MQQYLEHYRRGHISFNELCLIGFAEGYDIVTVDGHVAALPVLH